MAIQLLTKELESKWREFVNKSDAASIYHTLEWREIASAFKQEPLYIVSTKDNGEVDGILPLYYISGIFGRRMVSVSLRDKGGVVASDGEALRGLIRYAINLAKEKRCVYLELKGAGIIPEGIRNELELVEKDDFIQTQIKIESNEALMWERLHQKSVRWAINKAMKAGVNVSWHDDTQAIKNFYRLFVSTRHKLGVPVFSYDLFEKIHKNFISRGWAGCFLAEYKDRPVASLIYFAYKGTITEAYAASDEHYLNLRPNNLLLWELLVWGANKGYKVLDMGAEPAGNRGMLKFKSRWGGTQGKIPYYYYFYKKCNIASREGDMANLFRFGWRLLPQALTKKIGPALANQAS